MGKQLVKKSVKVKASREKVWDVLLRDEYTREWYSEFSPGSHAEGDWNVGGRVTFTDASGSGLAAKVTAREPYERLSIEHQAVIMNGREERDSEDARKWKGCREDYILSQEDGLTTLTIEQELPEEYVESISKLWDKAAGKIKELSERTR